MRPTACPHPLPSPSWPPHSRHRCRRPADQPAGLLFQERRRTSSRSRGTGRGEPRRGEPPHTPDATPVSSMPSAKVRSSSALKAAPSPGGGGGGGGATMATSRDYSVNLSVQQVLSLWVQGATLQHFTGMRGRLHPPGRSITSIFKALQRSGRVESRSTAASAETPEPGCWFVSLLPECL